MLCLNKLLGYAVKIQKGSRNYLFWEHLKHRKIAENLPNVKKLLKNTLDGINFLEAKSTTLQKIEFLVTPRNI